MIDFAGDISMDKALEHLRADDDPTARALLQRIVQDRRMDDLLLTVSDCLKDHLREGITEDLLSQQLTNYVESE